MVAAVVAAVKMGIINGGKHEKSIEEQ